MSDLRARIDGVVARDFVVRQSHLGDRRRMTLMLMEHFSEAERGSVRAMRILGEAFSEEVT